MLEANPLLNWRDIRYLLSKSTTKNDSKDIDWVRNSAGMWVNHKYGFGLINTQKAIENSLVWENLPKEIIISNDTTVNQIIPENGISITNKIYISENIKIEFIDIFFNAPSHERLGDLKVVLYSPTKSKSILAEKHHQIYRVTKYENWRFGTMRHLGESSQGEWELVVYDLSPGITGSLESWGMKLYGHYNPKNHF